MENLVPNTIPSPTLDQPVKPISATPESSAPALIEMRRPSAPTKTTVVFPHQARVWIPDAARGFALGSVTQANGLTQGTSGAVVKVVTRPDQNVEEDGIQIELSAQATWKVERAPHDLLRESDQPTHDDLSNLPELSRPCLLLALRKRYEERKIYSAVGPAVLIAVNPFERVEDLYDDRAKARYALDATVAAPPHVYALALRSFRGALNGVHQSCVFSGESGAGKTEAAKIFLGHLAYLSQQSSSNDPTNQEATLRARLLEANPLVEAFGNAKTSRNYNSSRFGSWIECLVNPQGVICGASMTQYLLEKTRVVTRRSDERNYHFFYQLMAMIHAPEAGALNIKRILGDKTLDLPAKYARVLGEEAHFDLVNDHHDFHKTLKAMQTFDVDARSVIRVVAGIMSLTRVEFESVFDAVTREDDCASLTSETRPQLLKACEFLGLNPADTIQALTHRDLSNVKEEISKPHTKAQAEEARDALCKHIYAHLFDWLVRKVNEKITSIQPSSQTVRVGILDTFGFETFAHNSFEQLLINYCNERVLRYYHATCIESEERVYREEGLSAVNIQFETNDACIDLFSNFLFPLLDDEIKLPKSTDTTWLTKIRSAVGAKNATFVPHVSEAKIGAHAKFAFGVKHYAGEVHYSASEFLDKNKDAVPIQLERLLTSSGGSGNNNTFLAQQVFNRSGESSGSSSSTTLAARACQKLSLATRFQQSLEELIQRISTTTTSFVRCVKPNDADAAFVFNGALVLDQLSCNGILEACRLRKNGYEVRPTHEDFIERFSRLIGSTDLATIQKRLAQKCFNGDESKILIGKTRVFLKERELNALEKALMEVETEAAKRIQALVRGKLARNLHAKDVVLHKRLMTAMKKCENPDLIASLARQLASYNPKVAREATEFAEKLRAELRIEATIREGIHQSDEARVRKGMQEADACPHDLSGRLAKVVPDAVAFLKEFDRTAAARLQAKEAEMHARATRLQRVARAYLCRKRGDRVETEFQLALAARDYAKMRALLKTVPFGLRGPHARACAKALEDHEARKRAVTERVATALNQCVEKGRNKLNDLGFVNFEDVAALKQLTQQALDKGVQDRELLARAEKLDWDMRKSLAEESKKRAARSKRKWWSWFACGCAN